MKISSTLLSVIAGGFICSGLNAQISFTNSNSLLHTDAGVAGSNAGNRSSNSVLVVDVNNDGLDDIVKLDNNRYVRIEYQQPNGTFNYQYIGDFTALNVWGSTMADFDHNGYKDFVLGVWNTGSNAIRVMFIGPAGSMGIVTLPTSAIASQNVNAMDVNNDGWEDIFVCNDVNPSKIWRNNGSGGFIFDNNTTINFDVTPGTSAPNDESGNYGSVWSDFDNDGDVDLYIIHCRQGQPAGDLRRTNVLFENNGNGTYTPNAAAHNLASNDQDWTGSFGDIDNDGDFDLLLTGHESGNTNRVFLNNNGVFSLLTTVPFGSMPQQAFMEDFDNDGWIDIMMSGANQQRLHRNNGNNTFTQVSNATLGFGSNTMLAFACGDLNHDGKIDMYSSYGTTYNNPSASIDDVLWLNSTNNTNHFLSFVMNGTISTPGALGARVFIYHPSFGGNGVQTREVRASESYGTLNTFHLHFGLGSVTTVDSVRINWPSGSTSLMLNVAADQFITVIENQCTLSNISINYSGSTTLCPGDSILLTAPSGAGYTYEWSDGSTSQSVYASNPGGYTVTVYDGAVCAATSPSVNISVNPDETPEISADGPIEFCPGGSVDLTSTAASSYTWSDSQSGQTITVSNPGTYFVTVPGLCQNWVSDSIVVSHYPVTAPTGNDVYLPNPNTTVVSVTGDNISWFDALVGGNLLGTGNNYNTPFLVNNTTYYAEDAYAYGEINTVDGSSNIAAATYSANSLNGYLIFDVLADCDLLSVTVETDVAGDRIIELRDQVGAVISSQLVTLAVGQNIISLNWPLTVGSNYQLGTNSTQNQSALGFISPRLKRIQSGAPFPYDASGLVSITTGHNGTSNTPGTYYYFFDWQLHVAPEYCISDRTAINVVVDNLDVNEPDDVFQLNVYPNPASGWVNVELTSTAPADLSISIIDLTGRTLYKVNGGNVNGFHQRQIPLTGLAQGVYKLQLMLGDKTVNTLIVVQ